MHPAFGSALDGAEAGRGDRSRLAGSLLVKGAKPEPALLGRGEGGAYSASTDEAALQQSCGQAAARPCPHSSPPSLVITFT